MPGSKEKLTSQLWAAYKSSPSTELRNRLMEIYLPLVRRSADRLRRRLVTSVEVEDLFACGVFGLADAIENFEPGRRIKFETFSARRIRGAMLDELRAIDFLPRGIRNFNQSLEMISTRLRHELGRVPTDEEIAARLGVSGGTYLEMRRHAQAAALRPLAHAEPPGGRSAAQLPADRRATDPAAHAQRESVKQTILQGLSRSERLIIVLYYYEQMTFKEIGLTLDLSESRVSQIHTSILKRLQARFASPLPLLDDIGMERSRGEEAAPMAVRR